jgi:hypothetical protein
MVPVHLAQHLSKDWRASTFSEGQIRSTLSILYLALVKHRAQHDHDGLEYSIVAATFTSSSLGEILPCKHMRKIAKLLGH